jgi:hypothetical protein
MPSIIVFRANFDDPFQRPPIALVVLYWYACVEKKSVTAGRTVTPARSFFRRKKYLKHSSHHAGCMNVALRLYLRQQVHHAVSSEGIHPIDRSLLDECIENNYTIPLCLWS